MAGGVGATCRRGAVIVFKCAAVRCWRSAVYVRKSTNGREGGSESDETKRGSGGWRLDVSDVKQRLDGRRRMMTMHVRVIRGLQRQGRRWTALLGA